ncbi:MAG: hypothetical protein Q7W45_00985 [Bacteroidota bacterium]|nr:hypothetical protein [Bacteroidota bacterium]MDP3146673.1 hypothetical protein [Bacteroidota bacterium]
MSKKKNKKSSKKNQSKVMTLTQPLETKGNGKNTAIETLKDIAVGVIGGGLAGAAIGKPSLLTGIGTSLIGHYVGVPLMTSFGFGMMASGTYQMATGSVNGVSGLEGVKERVQLFKESLKQRLYLDKIIKPKKKEDEGANGMGSVQYFKYPNTENKELDMGSMDNIEREIARLGEQYERKQMTGMNDDINGIEDKLY